MSDVFVDYKVFRKENKITTVIAGFDKERYDITNALRAMDEDGELYEKGDLVFVNGKKATIIAFAGPDNEYLGSICKTVSGEFVFSRLHLLQNLTAKERYNQKTIKGVLYSNGFVNDFAETFSMSKGKYVANAKVAFNINAISLWRVDGIGKKILVKKDIDISMLKKIVAKFDREHLWYKVDMDETYTMSDMIILLGNIFNGSKRQVALLDAYFEVLEPSYAPDGYKFVKGYKLSFKGLYFYTELYAKKNECHLVVSHYDEKKDLLFVDKKVDIVATTVKMVNMLDVWVDNSAKNLM